MAQLVDEYAQILSNKRVGPLLHLITLSSPQLAQRIQPGQFVHMKVPGAKDHVLRRPFSVYDADAQAGTIEVLYQEVGSLTRFMPCIQGGQTQLIGPIGQGWTALDRLDNGNCSHVLLVGGGVGAAPLYLLARALKDRNCPFDIILGAQTKDALVTRGRYEALVGDALFCTTDDGTYGRAGFCTSLVEERLSKGCSANGAAYDYVAVCGPAPLMKIVAGMACDASTYCEVSLEKRMACGIGACLSCVVDTTSGKRRACVDGPVFDAREVVW